MFKSLVKIILIVVVVFLIESFALGLFWKNSKTEPVAVETPKAKVLGQEDEAANSTLKSQDFRMEQVTVGGGIVDRTVFLEDNAPLKISDVSTTLYTTRDTNETEMAISWKTNKATKGQIDYTRKGEYDAKSATEKDYGLVHMAILPALTADSIYDYTITSRDRAGEAQTSNHFIFYTGAPNVSLIDVLQGATQKAFGWAMKKKP